MVVSAPGATFGGTSTSGVAFGGITKCMCSCMEGLVFCIRCGAQRASSNSHALPSEQVSELSSCVVLMLPPHLNQCIIRL